MLNPMTIEAVYIINFIISQFPQFSDAIGSIIYIIDRYIFCLEEEILEKLISKFNLSKNQRYLYREIAEMILK